MDDLTICVQTPKVDIEGFDPLGVGVHRASTIVFKDAEAYKTRREREENGYSYGLYGTPTTRTLEEKLTQLEEGARTFLVPSGQAANTLAVLPFLSAGDKILLADTVYPPMRDFADSDLARFAIEVEYYDPMSTDDLVSKMSENTRMVWCESPGSTTMEVQDIPRCSEIAHQYGAIIGCDNTWATPLNFKPLLHGADIVTEGLTKYIAGHSDVLMGSITVKDESRIQPVRNHIGRLGIGVSPDDASLVLRGLETLAVRLKFSWETAHELMEWISNQPQVERLLHPCWEGSPGQEIWTRDAHGGVGVFGICFKPEAAPHISSAIDALNLFRIGASWGGTQSLVAPMPVRANRTATKWTGDDLVLRVSIGLEAETDLKADLEAFFDTLTDAMN